MGLLKGKQRDILAVVTPSANNDSGWSIVNVQGIDNKGQDYYDSIAVMGALGCKDAQVIAKHFAQQYFSLDSAVVVDDVIYSSEQGLQRALDADTFKLNKPMPTWFIQEKQDMLTGTKVEWDSANPIVLKSHGGDMDMLLMDMQKHDDNHGLVFHYDSLSQMLQAMNDEELIEYMSYDGVYLQYAQFDKFKNKMLTALDSSANQFGEKGVKAVNVETSEPFKRGGKTQVALMVKMSDEQSVSFFFHNPDSTPAKVTGNDVLLLWKIALNGRDVTGFVQSDIHENGDTMTAIKTVAMRIMQLVNKNSSRFKRTQAKKAQQVQELEDTQKRIEEKQATLQSLIEENKRLELRLSNVQLNQSVKRKNNNIIDTSQDEFANLDLSTEDGKETLRKQITEQLQSMKKAGGTIYCSALDASVYFDTKGIKKLKSFTGNPIKLLALTRILSLIKNATLVKKDVASYDVKEQQRGITYVVLKTPFTVDNVEYGARLVVRKIDEKNYQYDLQIADGVDFILDSANSNDVGVSANESDLLHHWLYDNALLGDMQDDEVMLDSANSSKGILNLFIFDKDGNLIDENAKLQQQLDDLELSENSTKNTSATNEPTKELFDEYKQKAKQYGFNIETEKHHFLESGKFYIKKGQYVNDKAHHSFELNANVKSTPVFNLTLYKEMELETIETIVADDFDELLLKASQWIERTDTQDTQLTIESAEKIIKSLVQQKDFFAYNFDVLSNGRNNISVSLSKNILSGYKDTSRVPELSFGFFGEDVSVSFGVSLRNDDAFNLGFNQFKSSSVNIDDFNKIVVNALDVYSQLWRDYWTKTNNSELGYIFDFVNGLKSKVNDVVVTKKDTSFYLNNNGKKIIIRQNTDAKTMKVFIDGQEVMSFNSSKDNAFDKGVEFLTNFLIKNKSKTEQEFAVMADIEYLKDIADGNIELTVENMNEHINKIEQIAERLGDEHEDLIEKALDKYTEFALSVKVG